MKAVVFDEGLKLVDDYKKPILNMKKNSKNHLLFGAKYPRIHLH